MKKYFKVKNTLAREFLAETFGIFILIVFGCGSVAQHVFTPREDRNVLSINLAFGFGATLAGK
jgi:aquaporin-9